MLPNYLQELNENQLKAAQTLNGPVLIKAGAGSGKTKTAIARIHNLIDHGVNPQNILAITFTNKAANDLKRRLPPSAINITASTIHSFCVKILRQYPLLNNYTRSFTIIDTNDEKRIAKMAIQDYIEDNNITNKSDINKIKDVKPRLLVKLFELDPVKRPQDNNKLTKLMQTNIDIYNNIDLIKATIKYYHQYCQEHNMMDFNDLLYNAVDLIKTNDDVLHNLQQQYQYISVDEYQDTSAIQEELIRLIANTDEKNICVIGDPNQSIYAFRGANISNILNFTHQYPNAKVVNIMHNYRSTQNILNVANDIIKPNDATSNLVAVNTNGDKPIEIINDTDSQEADSVTNIIKSEIENGVKPNQIAVLYRMNALSYNIETRLTKLNIPYTVVGSVAFYDRAEIKDLMSYLRLIANHYDDLAFERIINTPSRHIGTKTIDLLEVWSNFFKAKNYSCSLFDVAKNSDQITKANGKPLPPSTQNHLKEFVKYIEHFDLNQIGNISDIVKEICKDFYINYVTDLDSKEADKGTSRYENVGQFVNIAKDFDTQYPNIILKDKISQFLQNISLTSNDKTKQDGVQLMTIHSSKGLEFDDVFVIGWETGILPAARSVSREALQEERRLAYVAVTRAKKKLFLTYANLRNLWGQSKSSTPSIFLSSINNNDITKQINKKQYNLGLFE